MRRPALDLGGFISDRTQAHLGWGTLGGCALTVLATVVSRPTPTRAIVDVGTKGLTSDPSPLPGFGSVRGYPDVEVTTLTEEHGILTLPRDLDLPIGTRVEIIPNHACGVINMVDQVAVVADGLVEECWQVAARGSMH